MSFLQQGRWSRPVLALGFDPREVVRQAVLNGTLPTVVPNVRKGGRGIKYRTEAERLAARKDAKTRWIARHLAAGLTVTGKPLQVTRRPELRGLPPKEYHARYMRLKRGLPASGPIRKYRRKEAKP